MAATENPNFPNIIKLALAKIDNLITSDFFRRGRSYGYKAMKADRAQHLKEVLEVQLKACCMEFDGSLCRVSKDTARPLTMPEMAKFAGQVQRTTERAIHDLIDLGLIRSEKQFKHYFPVGLKVAAVWRVFTKLFWELLGLWDLFVESVKYAAQHAKLKLKNPIKLVGKLKISKNEETERLRRCKQQNIWFMAMTQCVHRSRCKDCLGGYQAKEICTLCRQFPA